MGARFPVLSKTLLLSRVFLLLSTAGVVAHVAAQPFATKPTDGERLDYTVTYEWGPFYLEVGDVSFTTASMAYSGNQLWSFEGWGASRKHWNWFYPVNSIYASVADAQLSPINFQRRGQEGSHTYDRWYFLKSPQEVRWISADPELKSGALANELEAPLHDVMTAVHHCRYLPWRTTIRETRALNLILDGKCIARASTSRGPSGIRIRERKPKQPVGNFSHTD